MNFKKLVQGVRQAKELVRELVALALEIGTLIAVIKMVFANLS